MTKEQELGSERAAIAAAVTVAAVTVASCRSGARVPEPEPEPTDAPAPAPEAAATPASASVTLDINGARHELTVDRERSLLDVLRHDLGLTGAKYGCGEGQCGACTVLLDVKPTRSCTRKAISCGARVITTVEGLAAPEPTAPLHPVQQAFIDEQAMQCGYCTPGMIMAAVGLLRATPRPSDEQIVAGMKRNLCRCGTYPRILRAVRRAADPSQPPEPAKMEQG